VTAPSKQPVVLITGAAKRVGARMVRVFHGAGYNVVLHYHSSVNDAASIRDELNRQRNDSVVLLQQNLTESVDWTLFEQTCLSAWGRLDVLINNASSFYATPFGKISEQQWTDLMGSNLKAPLFLSQALVPLLKQSAGCIINIVDIYGDKPLGNFPVYSIAKAGLSMLTRSLAMELAPEIRVNGIAPGAVMWPQDMSEGAKNRMLGDVPLQREGSAQDVARTALFLATDAPYISGQIVAVDGGLSI
jgi:pteridine reductase